MSDIGSHTCYPRLTPCPSRSPSPVPLPEPVARRACVRESSLVMRKVVSYRKKKDCRNSNPTIINNPHPFSLTYHYTTVGLIFNFLLNHKPLRRMKIRTYLIKRLPPLQPRMLNICLLALNTSTPPPPSLFHLLFKVENSVLAIAPV